MKNFRWPLIITIIPDYDARYNQFGQEKCGYVNKFRATADFISGYLVVHQV